MGDSRGETRLYKGLGMTAIVVSLVTLHSSLITTATALASEVRAGVAQAPFVLPDRVPLAGYSRRRGDASTGIRDPIGVRALVVQDDDTTAALVSSDLVIINEQLSEAVHNRLAGTRVPGDTVLLLAATHTHAGPGAYGNRFIEKLSMGHYDATVFDALVRTMTDTIVRAHEALAPVRVAYAVGMTDGLVRNRVFDEGIVDPELLVSGFYRLQERDPFAVLVNFSAHPTALGAWNLQLSGDYPGVLMREIEQRFPGTTCLFFAGSVGDQAPVKLGSDYEPAERIGLALAGHVITAVRGMQPKAPARVTARQDHIPLPPAQVRIGGVTLPRWFGSRLVDDDATLSVLLVGPTAFIGIPCDMSVELGRELKQAAQANGLNPVLVGFANDYIGYCVPESLYRTGHYEAGMAFNGPKTGRLIVEHLVQMLDRLAPDD